MKKVCVLLADGFEEIEAITVIDLLRRANVFVDTVSITGDHTVHGGHGINVQSEDLFEEADFAEMDMVVLPGGGVGTANLAEHPGVRRLILDFNKDEKLLAAICAAPSIFGKLGILKGRRATCYPGVEKDLHGTVIMDRSVVVDGNIITGRSAGGAIDFALALIEALFDRKKAKEIADAIVY
ncbi:DJ-1/PfpI family protein [Lachnospiraceae bacterium OttesenSCG-928-J05]|nr:DJ-1/PfpI family protein [Lachnospiraceae bacterium OttesenSCG-928-J05]